MSKYEQETRECMQDCPICGKSEMKELIDWHIEKCVDKIKCEREQYKRGFEAAANFIDSHVADPDITDEMCITYDAYITELGNIKDMKEKGV